MPATLETKTLLVAFLVGLAHIGCGIAVLIEPVSLTVTALAGLDRLCQWFDLSHRAAGCVLLLAGISAVVGARFPISNRARIILFIPQQALLLMMIWTISVALVTGVYPDGYSPRGGGWFIESDQIWAWILAVSHSAWLAAYLYGEGARRGHFP
jgi:hypothetical protein